MFSLRAALSVFFLALSPVVAGAQQSSIATSAPGGSVHNLGLMVAEAAGAKGIDLRVTPFKSTTQAIPVVAAGEVNFGLANAYELQMAVSGTLSFEGRPIEGLQAVAALYPFKMGLMVRESSDIRTMADLEGLRVPAGFGATATGEYLIGGMLAAAEMSYDMVEKVTVSSFQDMQKAFQAGRIDTMIAIVGSARDARISDSVGGIRVLGIPGDSDAEARIRSFVPVARAEPVLASEKLVGVTEDMFTLTYDYFLYTSADTPSEDVSSVLQAIVDGKDEITAAIPAFVWFDLSRSGSIEGLSLHQGAKVAD